MAHGGAQLGVIWRITMPLSLPAIALPRPPALPAGPPALLGLLPPTGASLRFGSGPAQGGGSLDYRRAPNPRLSGSLDLKLSLAQVSALAILEEVAGSVSLFTLLSARFAPGLQLGFGFAISGLGGLIGINRSVDAGALEGQFRSGALTHALFGDDPIRNATSVLATLGAVFPARAGAAVFGPTLQLSWLKVGSATLFNADLGVFMQLPGPSRIDILGSARAALPPVFRLQLDLHGEIDLAGELIGFHAVIVDSHVMGLFRLTGEAIFRWHYGAQAYVVLTIGGFFPGFNPAPARLPAHIQRVGLVLDLPVSLPISLRAEGYLAVTANTFQFGGRLEASIDGGFFGAHGHIHLDALFQFSPFHFVADFAAGFRIEVLGETFHGVTCQGHISGPGPLVIQASITYETPFFLPDISWSDTFVIGESVPRDSSHIASLLDIVGPALQQTQNLRAENGADPSVSLRQVTAAGAPLVSSRGSLVWSQRRVPLNMVIERVENIPLATPQSVSINASVPVGAPPLERFQLGQFYHLSAAEKLNLSGAVEDHPAGVRLDGGEQRAPAPKKHTPGPDDYYKPARAAKVPGLFRFLSILLVEKVDAGTRAATVANLEPQVAVKPEAWQVGAASFTTQSAAQAQARRIGRPAHLAHDLVSAGDL